VRAPPSLLGDLGKGHSGQFIILGSDAGAIPVRRMKAFTGGHDAKSRSSTSGSWRPGLVVSYIPSSHCSVGVTSGRSWTTVGTPDGFSNASEEPPRDKGCKNPYAPRVFDPGTTNSQVRPPVFGPANMKTVPQRAPPVKWPPAGRHPDVHLPP
jgi:hypothetical protein